MYTYVYMMIMGYSHWYPRQITLCRFCQIYLDATGDLDGVEDIGGTIQLKCWQESGFCVLPSPKSVSMLIMFSGFFLHHDTSIIGFEESIS